MFGVTWCWRTPILNFIGQIVYKINRTITQYFLMCKAPNKIEQNNTEEDMMEEWGQYVVID